MDNKKNKFIKYGLLIFTLVIQAIILIICYIIHPPEYIIGFFIVLFFVSLVLFLISDYFLFIKLTPKEVLITTLKFKSNSDSFLSDLFLKKIRNKYHRFMNIKIPDDIIVYEKKQILSNYYCNTFMIVLLLGDNNESFYELRKKLYFNGIKGNVFYVYISNNKDIITDYLSYSEDSNGIGIFNRWFVNMFFCPKENKLYVSKVIDPSQTNSLYSKKLIDYIVNNFDFEVESQKIIRL